jgi:iron complex outermembrane receptor protein
MKQRYKQELGKRIRGGVLIGAALASAAAAAQAPDADAIATVTVTATRRNASLQSVPVAVSVVDGEQLERGNRTSIDSVLQEVPSAVFRQQGGNKDSTIFVRGIGTISTSPGVEPTVSTLVDGVVYARPGQATVDLFDIDRLEVLRGPQGTLFGKNASSGVLNIISRAPSEQRSGFVDGALWQGKEKRVRAGVSGAIAPGLARASLSAAWADYEGNVENLAGGARLNGYKRKGVRARVDLTPTRELDVVLIADYLRADSSPTQVAYRALNAAFAQGIAPVLASPGNRSIRADLPSAIEDSNKGLSAQLNWRKNGYTLTSISAVREWDNTQRTSSSPIANGADPARVTAAFPGTRDKGTLAFRQVSQELRVASPGGGALDYVAGLFYLHASDAETYQRIVTTTRVDSGLADYGVRSDSYAAFGEATWHVAPSWRLIGGARWTHDDLDYRHVRNSTQATAFPGVQPFAASSGSTAEDGYSGRLGIQHELSAKVNAYATFSRGYKGPAFNVFFNMLARDTLALKPETSNSLELGLKSTLFDKRLSVNAALFKTDYANYQANFYDTVAGAVVTRLINAGDVSTQGLEIDVSARPLPQLRLSAAAAYTEATVEKFNCPPAAAASCKLDGKTLPFSPRLKSFVRASWTLAPAAGLRSELSLDYSYQSRVQYDLFQSPDTIQPGYGVLNAEVLLSAPAGGWRLALVGKNLANKSYATNLITGAGYVTRTVARDERRYFGITARKEF